jgi:hypothetical protein
MVQPANLSSLGGSFMNRISAALAAVASLSCVVSASATILVQDNFDRTGSIIGTSPDTFDPSILLLGSDTNWHNHWGTGANTQNPIATGTSLAFEDGTSSPLPGAGGSPYQSEITLETDLSSINTGTVKLSFDYSSALGANNVTYAGFLWLYGQNSGGATGPVIAIGGNNASARGADGTYGATATMNSNDTYEFDILMNMASNTFTASMTDLSTSMQTAIIPNDTAFVIDPNSATNVLGIDNEGNQAGVTVSDLTLQTVPEPAPLGLLAVSGLGLLRRRKH